jgi:hypothetical protein
LRRARKGPSPDNLERFVAEAQILGRSLRSDCLAKARHGRELPEPPMDKSDLDADRLVFDFMTAGKG